MLSLFLQKSEEIEQISMRIRRELLSSELIKDPRPSSKPAQPTVSESEFLGSTSRSCGAALTRPVDIPDPQRQNFWQRAN